MKPLVFTTAVGEAYQKLADRLFKGLRYGRYTGDIIALCSRGYEPRASVDVRPIVIRTEVFDEIKRPIKPSHRPRMARFYLDKLVDISGYDQVFYIDCDCQMVDMRDFNVLLREGNWFTRRSHKFGSVSYINDRYATHCMSLEQIKKIGNESTINSGTWNVRVSDYPTMAHEVRKIFRERCRYENDQPALNAFCYENRETFPWQFFHDDEIMIVMSIDAHLNAMENTILIHPAGRPK